MFSTHFLHQKS